MTELLISKSALKEQLRVKPFTGIVKDPVEFRDTNMALRGHHVLSAEDFGKVHAGARTDSFRPINLKGEYDNGFDVPIFGPKKNQSIRQMAQKKKFDLKELQALTLKGNTLPQNWQDLWDAMRLDLTIRKQANPTIRENFYGIQTNTNFTRIISPTELNPYGIVFAENNGEGQSVRQGANMGGSAASLTMAIYAAGYEFTLMAQLFDQTWDLARLNDGVAVGYSALRDDLAVAPIKAQDYGAVDTAKYTAKSTDGTARQEKLYNTIENALADFGKRKDPVTNKLIEMTGLVVLASPTNAGRISRVVSGLTSVNERNLGAFPEISKVISYNGDDIVMPNEETVSYDGIEETDFYIIKPNRRMTVAVKRGLTMEVSNSPDVRTLTQESRAWYFVETQDTRGTADFIQKVQMSDY